MNVGNSKGKISTLSLTIHHEDVYGSEGGAPRILYYFDTRWGECSHYFSECLDLGERPQ